MDFRLKGGFEERFGVPSVIVNDTVLGGIGELILWQRRGEQPFFYTNIGTGIGGGLYLDGRYHDGSGVRGGYLGNTWVPDWRDSRPGAMTRLELICSGKSIEKRLNTPGYAAGGSCLEPGKGGFPARTWRRAKGQGICSAARNWTGLPGRFPWAGQCAGKLPPPDRDCCGRRRAKMGDELFSRIRRYTEEYAFVADAGHYGIVESRLMDDAVLAGGLLTAANPGLAEWGLISGAPYGPRIAPRPIRAVYRSISRLCSLPVIYVTICSLKGFSCFNLI